jgi:hypothetical protein
MSCCTGWWDPASMGLFEDWPRNDCDPEDVAVRLDGDGVESPGKDIAPLSASVLQRIRQRIGMIFQRFGSRPLQPGKQRRGQVTFGERCGDADDQLAGVFLLAGKRDHRVQHGTGGDPDR